jgi:hypothetical protein
MIRRERKQDSIHRYFRRQRMPWAVSSSRMP